MTLEEKLDLTKNYVIYPDEEISYIDNELLIEIDLKSAYYSILKKHFNEYDWLIEKIEREKEKIKRNILISTNAKELLPRLQYYSKKYVIEIVKNFGLIDVVEFKKDGGVFLVTSKITDNDEGLYKYDDYIQYKIKKLHSYFRFNNTSLYYYKNDFVIKGKLKHAPKRIIEIYKQLSIDHKSIIEYTKDYFIFCIYQQKFDILQNLYVSEDNMILIDGKFEKIKNRRKLMFIEPDEYFNTFLEPYYKLL